MTNNIERAKSILVIDDDPSVRKLLQTILEEGDFNVLLAADGIYGMQLVRETKPDLILLDINMPGPDGYQVIQSVRESGLTPIIMITGNHSVEATQRCFELGADDFVTKPFRPAEVIARIRAKLKHTNS